MIGRSYCEERCASFLSQTNISRVLLRAVRNLRKLYRRSSAKMIKEMKIQFSCLRFGQTAANMLFHYVGQGFGRPRSFPISAPIFPWSISEVMEQGTPRYKLHAYIFSGSFCYLNGLLRHLEAVLNVIFGNTGTPAFLSISMSDAIIISAHKNLLYDS